MKIWKWLVKFYGFCKRTREQYIKEFVYQTYDGWGKDEASDKKEYVFSIEHYPFDGTYYPIVEYHWEYMNAAIQNNKTLARKLEKKVERQYIDMENGNTVLRDDKYGGGRRRCHPCWSREQAVDRINHHKEFDLGIGVKTEIIDSMVK